jgi:RNA polymerase sigma factor (sigma-70 family)
LNDFDAEDRLRFEQLVLPHVDAAFNLARWLLRSRADAEDVAQEALLRSYRFFRGFHGGDARAWLLQIVRNTCYTWLEKNRPMELSMEFDEELHLQTCATPETLAIAGDDRKRLTLALETLPPRFREILVLRELEGCSYKEIAAITAIPIGTVTIMYSSGPHGNGTVHRAQVPGRAFDGWIGEKAKRNSARFLT